MNYPFKCISTDPVPHTVHAQPPKTHESTAESSTWDDAKLIPCKIKGNQVEHAAFSQGNCIIMKDLRDKNIREGWKSEVRMEYGVCWAEEKINDTGVSLSSPLHTG